MTLRQLSVTFDLCLSAPEINAFRGAIATKVGFEHDLFHNHAPEDATNFAYRYPLIQYRLRTDGKPMLVCLNDGVDAIQALFAQPDWSILLNGEPRNLRIFDMQLFEHQALQTEKLGFTYTLHNWQALNQAAHTEFKTLKPDERPAFIQTKLVNAILNFGRGVNWHFDQPVLVEQIGNYRRTDGSVHGTILDVYTVSFRTNTRLPVGVGLGKAAARGFGELTKMVKR
jgi:hypothetical protein